MRALVTLSVQRRITILMSSLAVIAFGIVGYSGLSIDLLPDISYPSFTVQTEMADTAPLEIENMITRPVEETVGVLQGLQSIRSVSRSGMSEVTLQFAWDAKLDDLSLDIREKLDRLELPLEAEAPIVLRFDPSFDPILRLAYTGPGGLDMLRRIGDRKIKQELEVVDGVASARIRGGFEEEIQVNIDQERLAALGIEIRRIQQVVGASNLNLPGGLLQTKDTQLLLRLVNEFKTVEDIGALIVSAPVGPDNVAGSAGLVRLRDVAEVVRGTKDREEITRYNGEECVEISIYKEGGANTVATAKAVRAALEELAADLPEGHSVSVLFDQSRFIEQSIHEVRLSALIGGILAILVLIAFLRDVRSTLVIATSIPLSIIATFILMFRMDISLNIMSLGGLTLGIGMLVDNSIVVLEAIFRKQKQGLSRREAAIEGTTSVGGAVIASTLTTVAVFIPIVFVEGIAGQLFKDMSLTVTFSLLASLLVAVTLIPMLSSLGSQTGRKKHSSEGPDATAAAVTADLLDATGQAIDVPDEKRSANAVPNVPIASLGGVSRGYDRILRGALARPVAVLLAGFTLFGASLFFLLPRIGTELIPDIAEGEFFFEAKLPDGAPLRVTDRVLAKMEAAASEEAGLLHYYTTVGSRSVPGGLSLNDKGENLGQINLVVQDRSDEILQERILANLRESYEQIPDLKVKSGKPTYFSLSTPIELELYGQDLDQLREYSIVLGEQIREITGVVDVRSSLEAGSPEVQVRFDRAKLASLGLDMRTLSNALQDRVRGAVPTRFKEDDRQIDIRIRNQEEDRTTVRSIQSLVVPGPSGQQIRLLTVADITEARGPSEIHRLQQQRAALLSANISGRTLGDVTSDIEAVLASDPPPPGVVIEMGGQKEEMDRSFASLRFAIALAIFLVYLVMAATFESLIHPFLVLFTIPLALVGVLVALWTTGTILSVIVLIGVIMLVGIVVNNAIVLIDAINQLRRQGLAKRDAVIQAGHLRLRPILMTTLTTVLGLLPMALSIGEGAELRAPLALTVSSGLIVSTLLTLVVIPAAYLWVPSRMDRDTAQVSPPTT